MKNVRLFKIASVFALTLLVGFVFSTVNAETSIATANDVETTLSVDADASLAMASVNFEKCGAGKCGDGKSKDDKKKKTTKKKTTKKKKATKKTDCDKKTKKSSCGGGC